MRCSPGTGPSRASGKRRTMSSILTFCLRILPAILMVFGILGVMGIVSVGPEELPKRHPINQRLAGCVVLLGIGTALLAYGPALVSEIGLGVSVLAVILFVAFTRQARRLFPSDPDAWIHWMRRNYRFRGPPDERPPKDDRKES